MKKQFAKLFTLANGLQVLLVRSWSEEEQAYELTITTEVEGCRASVKMTFSSEDNCDECFDNFTEADAEERISETEKFLQG